MPDSLSLMNEEGEEGHEWFYCWRSELVTGGDEQEVI